MVFAPASLILTNYFLPLSEALCGNHMKKYYFWHWDESTGNEIDHWGTSDWYFEIGDDGYVARQLELFASGDALYYSENHIEDKFGMLSEGKFELLGEGEKEISQSDFEGVLRKTKFNNVPKAT